MASATLLSGDVSPLAVGVEVSWQAPNRAILLRFRPTSVAGDAREVLSLKGMLEAPIRGELDEVVAVGWLGGVATCDGVATEWTAVVVMCAGEIVIEFDEPMTLTELTMPETVRITPVGPAVDTEAEALRICLGCKAECAGALCPGCLSGCQAFDVGGQEARRLSVDELGRLA